MAKPTLIDIVQDILSAIDSDDVSSISETEEANQVAFVVRRVYREIGDNQNWPHQKIPFTLEGLGDVTKPTYLRIPSGIKELDVFNYNKIQVTGTSDQILPVHYLAPEDFLAKQNSLNSSNDNILTVTDDSGIKLLIKTDEAPTHWTSFDDLHVVSNSFDSDVDTTLQQSKTQCWGYKSQREFTLADSFVLDLPEEMFSYLVAECISVASVEIKQADNPKAEQQSRRQRNQMSQKSWKAKSDFRLPEMGRRSPKGRRFVRK